MRQINRKATPKVVDGQVRKKNNWEWTPDYYNTPQTMPLIDRQRPGKGYRHVLMQRDIETFIGLLPEWGELSKGLNAIVLAPGEHYLNGWHTPGVVAVCAWDSNLWVDYADWHYDNHKGIFDRLGVKTHPIENGGNVRV